MPQLAIAKDFLQTYAALDKKLRKGVDDALDKFADTFYAGGHLEKLESACDPRWRTLRINLNHRGIVLAPENGDLYLLVTVLPHNEAYRYIRNRRPSVNQVLGVLEFRDESAMHAVSNALAPTVGDSGGALFAGVPDKHFTQLGIDEETLRIARLLPDESHLDSYGQSLPKPQHDALTALASGMTPDEAWTQISRDLVEKVEPGTVDPDDLATAIRRSPDQAVFVEGPEELRELLDHPFDVWRTFLHPRQVRIARKKQYSGPVMVTGGAGTGKTVTALHRIAHLTERYVDTGTGTDGDSDQLSLPLEQDTAPKAQTRAPEKPILFTTFTKTLDAALQAQVNLLVPDEERRRLVDVRNIDKIAYQVVRKAHGKPDMKFANALAPRWDAHAAGLDVSGRFLLEEWEHVVLAQDLRTEREYMEAGRRGRGRANRLGEQQKRQVWAAILAATQEMREHNQWIFTSLAAEAADLLERTGERLYRHIVVDESQDLHPAKWRLVRALVDEGPDDLFIAGDPHQRIYDHHVSMARVGVNVRGRSHRLTVSYRSTQEILNWAVGVLGTAPVEGFDGVRSTLQDYGSPLHGRRPVLRGHGSAEEELDELVRTVEGWLRDGVEPDAIGIAARSDALVRKARSALTEAGIETCALAENSGVRVGTMHSMKGLEFRCVAVVSVGAEHLPDLAHVTDASEDAVAHAHDLQRERNLLFVACTRARDSLHVSYSGEPSPFLPRASHY